MERIKDKIKKMLSVDWGNADDNKSYDNFDEKERFMKFNRFFSNWKVFTIVYIAISVLILFLLIMFLSSMKSSVQEILGSESEQIGFWGRLYQYKFIIFIGIIAATVGYFKFAYLVRVSYGNINIGQKGTARWTTREEIEQQYKKISERDESFPGMGGIPIARDKDKIYIDDTNTNTLIVGGTRSGKDELYGRPFLDIISRAEEKCSMIITDPKLELAFSTIPTLRKRGYDTYILNYIDPVFSDGNNPLDMIKDEYKAGNIENAQNLCSSLGYYIFFPNPDERDPFWTDKARDVFTAFCYAEIEDNLKADIEENNRRKAAHDMKENERKKKYYKELYGENEYENYRKAVIIKSILNKEPNLTDKEVAEEFIYVCLAKGINLKCNKNEVEILRKFKFKNSKFVKEKYYPVNNNEKKITINSIVKMCNTLSQKKYNKKYTYLDMYFLRRSEDNFARLTYGDLIEAPPATKGSVMSVFHKGLSIFNYDNFAKLTAESTFKIEDIAFGKKPVAVFLGIPDYDKSKHFLATVFINQVIFLLSKLSLEMPKGELPRRVHLWINEFGNLPIFENLENHLTVGLGRNIVWTLLLQSYGQLDKYSDIKETIKDNCGNKIYIMASGEETTKEMSEDIGAETQTVVNRTGKKLSISKEFTEMSEEVPLMRPYQLKRLELGETIVIRTMKRTDNDEKPIKTHPIKNFGKNRMVMAHNYLKDIFPYDQLLYRAGNIDRVIRNNPELYRKIEFKVVDGYINTRKYINVKKHSRSGTDFIKYLTFRNEIFITGDEHHMDPKDAKKMNQVFNLMQLTEEERKKYKLAGTINEDGTVLMPEAILTNSDIERFARLLIKSRNKEDSMRGYMLLDILYPLSAKEKGDEEIMRDKMIEDAIAGL